MFFANWSIRSCSNDQQCLTRRLLKSNLHIRANATLFLYGIVQQRVVLKTEVFVWKCIYTASFLRFYGNSVYRSKMSQSFWKCIRGVASAYSRPRLPSASTGLRLCRCFWAQAPMGNYLGTKHP